MTTEGVLEATYEQHRDAFVLKRARLLMWLTLGLNPIWVILDVYLADSRLREVLFYRVALSVAVCAQLLLIRVERLRRWPELFLFSQMLCLGVSVSGMTSVLGGYSSEYYNGLNLLALCSAAMIPVHVRTHVLGQVAVLAHYILINLHGRLEGAQVKALTLHLYFLVTIFFICDVSVLLFGGFHRKQYEALRDLRHANDRLLGLDRAKSRLFENVSHELRTPLTLVLAAFDTLERSADAKATETLAVGRRNAASLLLLIEELLQIARFDAGVAPLNARPTDVAELVRTTAAQFIDQSRGRTIALRGASEPLLARVDRPLLRKAIHNLVGNAVKFTDRDHGHIAIDLTTDGAEVVLVVADDGIGIAPEQHERVFERFSQGDASPKFGGTGIGLALVKEVMTKHGGTVSMSSTPGRGARFEIRVPIGDVRGDASATDADDAELLTLLASATSRRDDQERTARAPATASAHLLVVEDNADLRAYLSDLLGTKYGVDTASDGAEALERIRARIPDLVVSDVMMPRMGGDELVRAIRADPALSRIPVILLTAKTDRSGRLAALADGADDYVTKPFDGEELLLRAANILALRAQEKELAALASELERANARLGIELEDKLTELGRAGRLKEFFPARIAEQLMSERSPRQRQDLTVLALDLATLASDPADAEAEHDALAQWLDVHHDIVARALVDAGAVIERVGVNTMAHFYGPAFANPRDQVSAAVHAARDVQSRLEQLATGRQRLRAAIASGTATIGVFGGDALRSFTAVGAPIDEARQLVARTPGGTIALAPSARAVAPADLLPLFDPGDDAIERWPIGSTIAGKYCPEAWIGSGASAAVYRARHLGTGGAVALKILHARTPHDEAVVRLARESRRAASLQSAHTVRVFDFGSDGDVFYLVMELVDGPTLADVLARGPMSTSRTLTILEQTARALGEAHEAGLVHRDVKPGNVIIIERPGVADFVKVVDFGLSRSMDTMTSASHLAGTPSYIAPEVWRGGLADATTDLYALGVVAYEMLAGRTPFAAADVARLGLLHCYQPVPALPDTIPGMVRELVYWMLEKDPSRRPSSGADVAESIEALLAEGVG